MPKDLNNMTQAKLESLDLAEVGPLLESTPLLSNTSPEGKPHSSHNTGQGGEGVEVGCILSVRESP